MGNELSASLEQALNDHMSREFFSAYLYLGIAAYFEMIFLPGFAHWMRVQAREELEHAMKFYRFILDRGGHVALNTLDVAPTEYASPQAAVEKALEHERFITDCIHRLYGMATQEQDRATEVFLHWFMEEQVEEENQLRQILGQLAIVKDSASGLLILDQELGKRSGTF